MKQILATFAVLALLLGGCQSPNAFRTIKAVGLTADSASQAWADYVVAGHATAVEQARVREAHEKFRASYSYAIDVLALNPKSPPPAELSILALNLINLIAELKK